MIVEARVVGQPASISDRQLDFGAHPPLTLRALLGEIVTQELVAYGREQREHTVLRTLTPADRDAGASTGRYLLEARRPQEAPNLGVALARVIEAFNDGLYYAFADGYQIDDLDAVLPLRPDSTIRFIRLVALPAS
jgi:hypothetical protein